MITNVLILHYNNYFNKIVKKLNTINDYKLQDPEYKICENINFNPGNDIYTSIILGFGTNVSTLFDNGQAYDYLVIYNQENNEILHRWFILQHERIRSKQYKLTIKRDVLADNLSEILEAPSYIRKGYIDNINNPLLYAKENTSLNRIKQEEALLKDKTNTAWIVGYYAKNYTWKNGYPATGEPEVYSVAPASLSTEIEDATSLPFFEALNIGSHIDTNKIAVCNTQSNVFFVAEQGLNAYGIICDTNGKLVRANENLKLNSYKTLTKANALVKKTKGKPFDNGQFPDSYISDNIKQALINYANPLSGNLVKNNEAVGAVKGLVIVDNYLDYQNRIVRYQNQVYKLNFTTFNQEFYDKVNTFQFTETGVDQSIINYANAVSNYINSDTSYTFNPLNDRQIGVSTKYTLINITATPYLENEIILKTDSANMIKNNNDDVYNLFMIPFSNTKVAVPGGYGETFNIDPDVSILMAMQLATELGSNLFDIQILPYSVINRPLELLPAEILFWYQLREHFNYEWITVNNQKKSFIFFPQTNTFTSNISFKQAIDSYTEDPVINAKLENECTIYRLCSPNYNGIFEYNLSQFLTGNTGFNVYCTYRPGNPYIKLNPVYTGLYGNDFADSTGLICGGDFSLGVNTEKWVEYQIQNKNYQAIFDRQIQNLNVNASVQRKESFWSGIIGAAQAGMTGATAGWTAGSTGGTGVTGGIGAGLLGIGQIALSGWAAIEDRKIFERSIAEQKSFAEDNFGYQLGNIQALPNSVSKTSPLTLNNKIWPVLEKISCTDAEKDLFIDQIKWGGMTVEAIGTINDYLKENYLIKADILRLDNIKADSSITGEIYNEVAKGVYINEYSE